MSWMFVWLTRWKYSKKKLGECLNEINVIIKIQGGRYRVHGIKPCAYDEQIYCELKVKFHSFGKYI